MPRGGYGTSKQGERKSLEAFGNKYPLLARPGLREQSGPFYALAAYLAENVHKDDVDGYMLRLHNLQSAVESSAEYESALPKAAEQGEPNGVQP